MTISRDQNDIVEILLGQSGIEIRQNQDYSCVAMHGDGSDRIFYRIVLTGGFSCLAVFPSPTLAKSRQEAESCYRIGTHLCDRDVQVPKILAFDHDSGAILYEDFGNTLLFDLAGKLNKQKLFDKYCQALDCLITFQVDGVKGFKEEYCWDSSFYDRDLMLNRESYYFAQEFCGNLLLIKNLPVSIEGDFQALADRNSYEETCYVLHRDYQSRNLMAYGQHIKIIDFQGARFGPLAYDIASLLNDPYVDLSQDVKERLLMYYVTELNSKISLDHSHFVEGYYHIALQRNLQVLGAFAFLTKVNKKPFFKEFIAPALKSLNGLLSGPLHNHYTSLQEVSRHAENKYLECC